MSKGSFQGGLLMFKKSFTEAIQNKDVKSHNPRDKEKNKKPQESHCGSESAALSCHDTCSESKLQRMPQDARKSHRLRGRGRGQAQVSHSMSIPGNAKFSSNALSSKMSSGSRLSCKEYDNSRMSEIRNGESASVEVQQSDSRTYGETLHGNQRGQQARSRDKRLYGHDGQRLKNGRQETFKRTPPQKQMKENRKPEKETSIGNEVIKLENGHPIRDKNSPLAQKGVKQTDELFSTDKKTYPVRTLAKIQNMYEMYEDRSTEESTSSPLKNQHKGLEMNHSGPTENNTFSGKPPSAAEVGKTDSLEMIEPVHSESGKTESIGLMFVNKKKESMPTSSEYMALESAAITCLDSVESLENAVKNLSISETFQAIPDEEILILQEEIPLQDMESQSEMTNQEESRNVEKSPVNEAFSEEVPTVGENIDNIQETSASYFSEFGTSPEMEIFSQTESEPEDPSHEARSEHRESSNIHSPFFHYHPLYASFPNYLNNPEMNNNQYGAQKEHSCHERVFHPQFYPNPSTPAFNFFHPHPFASRSGSPPLIIPSDRFGSRESIELAIKYVVTQRQRYEEYAENCYGYCAPLDVIISVRESPMWTGAPYSRPRPYPSSWSYGVPPAFWPPSHWQDPAFRGSFAQSGPNLYSHTTMTRQCHEPVEETVDGDCISAVADDVFAPEEIEKKVSESNTRSDKPPDGGGETLQGKASSSDDDSGSCYSTANSEDISCNEETHSISLNRGFTEIHTNKAPIKKENISIKRMDVRNKKTNNGLPVLPRNSATTEKCTTLNGRVCKNSRKQSKLPNGRCSVSSFLTMEHLQNDWTSSPSHSSALPFTLNDRFRSVQPITRFPNDQTSSPSPLPSSSQCRKRSSKALSDRCAFSQTKEAKLSFKNLHAVAETDCVENKGNASFLSELSVSPKSTSGSIYFSPSWPGAVASPESTEHSFMSPLACSNQFVTGQRPRSRSLSSESNNPLYGASAQSKNPPMPIPVSQPVVTYPSGQFQTSPSPRDSWSNASPCNHFRRSFDRTDRWKIAFLNRSKSYSHTFIDSHCHIDFLYSRVNSPVVPFKDFMAKHADSFPANYEGCVSVFCHPRTFSNYEPDGNDILNVVSKEKGIWIAAGCHPKNAMDFKEEHQQGLLRILRECPNVVALGEIGLDYSGKFYKYKEVQRKVFRQQLLMAIHLNLPLVIHCRDADHDCLEAMQEIVPRHHKIHAHCFTRDLTMAHKWMSMFPNLYLGLTPVITYRSAHEAIETAAGIPLERLLLETDAPYFVPAGAHLCHSTEKYSHPGMALYTAETVAMLKGIPVDKVLKAARENTHIVYGI